MKTTSTALTISATILATLLAVQGALGQNPSQAGNSSVYFYDVAGSDTHGKGKLMVDLKQHTFVFNGQGCTPSALVELKARAADSTDYVVFAIGKATPSGNLHIAGTWEAAAAPADVVGSYSGMQISSYHLDNTGWFVAQLACYYSIDDGATWTESSAIKDIAKGHSATISELADVGVPPGALVKIHAVVVGGKDRTDDIVFQYYHSTAEWGRVALYEISGVTWNPKLYYHGVQETGPGW
jgi:hypothetical protein